MHLLGLFMLLMLTACGGSTGAAVGGAAGVPEVDDRSLIASELLGLIDESIAAVREQPESAAAWLELGMLYDANAVGRQAVTAYERARALAPADPRPDYHLARVLERTGQADQAISLLQDVLERVVDHASGQGLLGSWLLEAGRNVEAQAAFARCLELAPDGLEGSLGLARVAIAAGNGGAAIAVLQPVRERFPDVTEIRFLLGSALRLQGRLDDARVELAAWDGQPAPLFDAWVGEVARYTAGYRAFMDQAVTWGRSGEAGRAVEPLEALHRQSPDDSAVLEKLVAVYIDTGRLDDARRVLTAALQRDPSHYRTWCNLALLEEAAGQVVEALSAADQCLQRHPTWVRGHELRARLRWRAGNLPGAIDAMQSALEFGGARASTLQKLGRAQAILKRWDAARTSLETALELSPESAELHALLAEACAESGDLSRAWVLLDLAIARDRSDSQVGRVAARLSQIDPAGTARRPESGR
jgi:tetratricopeptide (TPR) repeat protein